ncbi:MAG: hypothetical protein CM1200mP29_14390 [Verrucomicrobiota bacterium]|nr:MAG: hypothetical protein CM1200mP29_14390 [Verrucomicrobiota bacterium]
MGGVGFWLQRNKENLKNYGPNAARRRLCRGVFTTYAAHVIPPVKIIDNATLALLLMFAWGGFMVWVADRLKSETIALFATGASYYASYVPLIHADVTGGVSWVILFSNLILAVGAVMFIATEPLAEDAGVEPVGVLRRFSPVADPGWTSRRLPLP